MHTDLNADAGESFGNWTAGNDAALFPELTSVNLALGFHAGDPLTLRESVALAVQHGLGIGAHPGYPDLQGFGRRAMNLSPDEIYAATVYQIGALQAFLRLAGAPLQHVKAHGALYMRIHEDPQAGAAFCRAVRELVPEAGLVTLAGPAGEALTQQAREQQLTVWREAFPERAYIATGQLAPRSLPGSSIHDPQEAARRAAEMARGHVTSLEGQTLELQVDTLCIHGDNPQATEIARAVRAQLAEQSVTLRAMGGGPNAGALLAEH
ncbi:5-oxoprolinase subunit PxpA [Deinococcus sp. SL84]|uniref:5-oxoprolinase subunit PxpA n=1 Tax=Deinococcus sp. SL84 TaxID=2994663 RepID=UPI002274C902|nr:5-oxoprolinase subunit PxpA [Deinococcus sp. SL84]MCY1703510.1 LamB/YcsF family protein [Deinococcus sp. SL84]